MVSHCIITERHYITYCVGNPTKYRPKMIAHLTGLAWLSTEQSVSCTANNLKATLIFCTQWDTGRDLNVWTTTELASHEHQANIPQPKHLNKLPQAIYLYESTNYGQFHTRKMIGHKRKKYFQSHDCCRLVKLPLPLECEVSSQRRKEGTVTTTDYTDDDIKQNI